MAIWKDDDPPFNIGTPRESHLYRRVWRLTRLEKKKPGKFKEQLEKAKKEYAKEVSFTSWYF